MSPARATARFLSFRRQCPRLICRGIRVLFMLMKHRVVIYGEPVLREKAQRVDAVTEEIRKLAADMIETMRSESGVGLAAEQIGRREAVCVVEVPADYDKDEKGNRLNPNIAMPWVLINPEIAAASKEKETAEEGCLSFPGIFAPVTRPIEVTVRFMDLKGNVREERVRKFVARAVQHEIDHLNGVLLVDRMSPVKRIAVRGKLRTLREQNHAI
jgi:peptide deformylase